MARLHIVPIHLGAQAHHLRPLAARIERALGLEARIEEATFDPETQFDPNRGQYNSTGLLAHLLRDPSTRTATRILGVTGVDLFIPVLTYVFGEAQLDGRAAVVSTYRLDNTVYGLPADEPLLLARLEKEAIHELGHTYGLLHCDSLQCVMRASTYVEEIDLKSERFCGRCRGELGG